MLTICPTCGNSGTVPDFLDTHTCVTPKHRRIVHPSQRDPEISQARCVCATESYWCPVHEPVDYQPSHAKAVS